MCVDILYLFRLQVGYWNENENYVNTAVYTPVVEEFFGLQNRTYVVTTILVSLTSFTERLCVCMVIMFHGPKYDSCLQLRLVRKHRTVESLLSTHVAVWQCSRMLQSPENCLYFLALVISAQLCKQKVAASKRTDTQILSCCHMTMPWQQKPWY